MWSTGSRQMSALRLRWRVCVPLEEAMKCCGTESAFHADEGSHTSTLTGAAGLDLGGGRLLLAASPHGGRVRR